MKDSDWEDCFNNNSARNVTPDINRAKSLKETALERIEVLGELTEKNCNYVFEDYYTSILELLQAINFIKGYNVSNHVCLGYFLRDVLNEEKLYYVFDDLRYKRNSLTYYGTRMEYAIALTTINKSKELLKTLNNIYKEL